MAIRTFKVYQSTMEDPVLVVFLILNERRFLFSSANMTFNKKLIETLNAYLNARLNESSHEEGYNFGQICHHRTVYPARILQSWTGTPVLIQRLSQHRTCGVPYLVE